MYLLYRSIFIFFVTATLLQAAPQEEKKPVVQPPFPDSEPELPLLPPPAKKPIESESAPMPRVNDTNKSFDVIIVAGDEAAKTTSERVAVGFFNHGERDLVLEIDSKPIKLDSRHYVQLKLPREFSWREKNGPMETTKVPADADGIEIVFRR